MWRRDAYEEPKSVERILFYNRNLTCYQRINCTEKYRITVVFWLLKKQCIEQGVLFNSTFIVDYKCLLIFLKIENTFPNNIFVPGEVFHGDAANSVKKSIIKSTKPNSMPRSKPSLIHFGENFLITSKLHDMIAISM